MTGHTAEEIVDDASEPRRLLGNAKACLWDIDDDELTNREQKRLSTILGKIDELEDIIRERELTEIKENWYVCDGCGWVGPWEDTVEKEYLGEVSKGWCPEAPGDEVRVRSIAEGSKP